jgi:hypothetical protein
VLGGAGEVVEPAAPSAVDPVGADLGSVFDSVFDSVFVAVRAELLLRALSRASFLAQPDPLKWMVGAERSLRIGPPQCSQLAGPWPWTPCITSTSRPQMVQP